MILRALIVIATVATAAAGEVSVEVLKTRAEQGDASAQSALGTRYLTGRGGVAKDWAEAARWFRPAAEKGNSWAQFQLARIYSSGVGKVLPKDLAEAMKWHRKAAEQGVWKSQYTLADAYNDGRGVPKDPIEAYVWSGLVAETVALAKPKFLAPEEKSMIASSAKLRQKLDGRLTAAQKADAAKLFAERLEVLRRIRPMPK